jgi:hypothetical protein
MTTQLLPRSAIRPAERSRAGRLWVALAITGTVLAAGTLFNRFLLWPWMQNWGATKAEVSATLPGDDLVTSANLRLTKGITIQAPPQVVYPWLLQLGVDRGGMYSYDWLENLLGLNVHTADRIIPEFQQVNTGDFWRFTPQDYVFNPGPGLFVQELQPERAVLLTFGLETKPEEEPFMSWQFVLQPQLDGSTRLLLRSNVRAGALLPIQLTYFVQFIMERKMLLGIRERAEG